ncbi:MAG: hypothetical protein IKE66_01135 [Hyphomicrobium sp.]|nr:hypothetical protein [Hyphomicrobium sp.]
MVAIELRLKQLDRQFKQVLAPLSMSLLLGTAGCASVSYITQNYSTVSPVSVATSYDTFNVFDVPASNKLMVNSSIGAAFVSGATFNVAATPKPMFQEAAERFLIQTGRQCRIVDGYALATMQWEFRYDCSGGLATSSILPTPTAGAGPQ